MKTCCVYFLILIISTSLMMSCQKEVDGLIDGTNPVIPVDQKPKIGTTWTFHYSWFNVPGGPTHAKMVTHRAQSEETFGGEKWLKIVDVEPDTVVYYLNTKPDGLYQYTNNNSYILCKYPTTVNDTYTTFNTGSSEIFTVRGVNDTSATGIGDIPLTKYEGIKPSDPRIIDIIWYNKNSWITWRFLYKLWPVLPSYVYALQSRMYIDNIVY